MTDAMRDATMRTEILPGQANRGKDMRLIDADATIKYLREYRCKDCDRRKGMKNGKVRFCYEIGDVPCRACDIGDTIEYFLDEDISQTVDAVSVEEFCAWLKTHGCNVFEQALRANIKIFRENQGEGNG